MGTIKILDENGVEYTVVAYMTDPLLLESEGVESPLFLEVIDE